MKPELVTVDQPNDHAILDLHGGDYGLVDVSSPWQVEVWYNHALDGSGVGNMTLEAFGKELDLEFCYTRSITMEEKNQVIALKEKAHG